MTPATELQAAGWRPEHPGRAWSEWIDPHGGTALPTRDALYRVRLRRAVELLEQHGWTVTTGARTGAVPGRGWISVRLLRGPSGQLVGLRRALRAVGLKNAMRTATAA